MKSEYTTRLESLHGYKGAFLRHSKRKNGNGCYYIKRAGSDRYSYINQSNRSEIEKVREAKYLEEAIRRLDQDIDLMKSLTENYIPFDLNSVNDNLPKIYRCEVPPVSELYEREGMKWRSERLEFQKRFPENYPQYKKHRTSDGILVKTISELVLYERFKAAGLVQIYELPFPADDHGPPLYPDFTILSPVDMKTEIIVEFVGRLDRQEYREDFARRVGRYIASGYTPGVDLFFIFNDKDGNVDSTQITKVISDIFGTSSMAFS